MSAEEIPDDTTLQLLEAAERQIKTLAQISYAEAYAKYMLGVIGEATYLARASVLAHDLSPEDADRAEVEVEKLIFTDIALRALHFAAFSRLGRSMQRQYESEALLEQYLED